MYGTFGWRLAMIFQHASVFYRGQFQPLDVQVEQDTITRIAPHLDGDEAVDCTGKLLLPGLIDLHSHGCIGYDFSTASAEEIGQMLRWYAAHGVTAVAATTITMGVDAYRRAVATIGCAADEATSGSHLLGINLEGPFLGKQKKGAHDPQYLIPPQDALFEELDALSGNRILLIDIDPELPGAMEFIRRYSDKKVLSLAHTTCGYETANRAVDCGATHVTHLFNGMNDLGHREPGIVGMVLERDVHAELICDGVHIHPAVLRMMFRLCPEKLVLISDSMCACGLQDGSYELGGLPVTVRGRKATLADGTLAGSVTSVFDGMRNLVRFGIPIEQAVLSATLIPAKAIHMDDRFGCIEVGRMADFLLTSPDLELESVYLRGERTV